MMVSDITPEEGSERGLCHIPVLVPEILELLRVPRGGIFFDGTVGLGGHSGAILAAHPAIYLYGTDRDSDALVLAREALKRFDSRFALLHTDFREIITLGVPVEEIDGFLFDLGVSSFQLDDPGKGFSYARNAPLDMRMDKSRKLDAARVVNEYTHGELCRVLRDYGEFSQPGRIADQIIFHRKGGKIRETDELKTIIRRICPRQRTMDPLARVFQAIRIEVNGELSGLEEFFAMLTGRMKSGARLAIISFHSLEDRIAKNVMKTARDAGMMLPLTKKPVTAGEEELAANPRSRSAKLRVSEKK